MSQSDVFILHAVGILNFTIGFFYLLTTYRDHQILYIFIEFKKTQNFIHLKCLLNYKLFDFLKLR
jgi:hypothetical protein